MGPIWQQTLQTETILLHVYHAILFNTMQYHTVQGNLAKHIGVLRMTFLYGNTTIITGASFVDTTDDRISHLTFDLQSDKTYFWNPLLLFINSDILIKLDMRPLFNDFFISQMFWLKMMTKFYNICNWYIYYSSKKHQIVVVVCFWLQFRITSFLRCSYFLPIQISE